MSAGRDTDEHWVSPPGAGDLTGDPFGYVTGVLAVIIHASYLVLIQKTSLDSEHGPLTAQYAIAVMASPVRPARGGAGLVLPRCFRTLWRFLV